jgi:signal transduction histidine kinase
VRWPELWEQWLSRKSVQWTLRIAFAAVITILLSQVKLDPLEFLFYDWRATTLPVKTSSNHVVLVGIDDRTIHNINHTPTAAEFAETLSHLARGKPRYLVSLMKPSEMVGTPQSLLALANISDRLGLIVAQNDLPPPGQKKLEPLPPPFQYLVTEPSPITHDRTLFHNSEISRRMIVRYQSAWTLPSQIARTYNPRLKDIDDVHGAFRFLDSDQVYVRYRGRFSHLSFSDVMKNNFDPTVLSDKVVILGRDSQKAKNGFLTAPNSKSLNDKSPLDVQANYIDNLITNASPVIAPWWITSILTFGICLLTMLIVLNLKPIVGLAALLLALSSVIAAAFLADTFDVFLPIASPLLGTVICYYFVLPYRLILENKKSWEYFEKNRLLTQVEELKSNFIRLMSHDLKTPLARIQAMSEIVNKEKDRLSPEQKTAVENIEFSTDELSQFIHSILNLSRIQSQKVKLDLRTRDITQLLQRVILSCEHLAQRKNIRVETDFEPLFSLRMDEDLMKQVFKNLVENAIKYSPENSHVTVSAREVNGKIQVIIADQGIGIPQEELPYVFERFYRAQNAEYENSGTGLGLYLAKYFVNLHNGAIEVESNPLKGSTFRVSLPLEMEEKGAAHV